LENAALRAAELGANTFQIFSSSPRMWRASIPDAQQVRLLRAARDRLDLHPLIIHVSYLINLASLDPVIRAKSILGFRGELERAAAIGADYLVLHPGSYRGATSDEGIAAFALGLRDAAIDLDPGRVTVLLENTVGAGCHLGSRFTELRTIRDLAFELVEGADLSAYRPDALEVSRIGHALRRAEELPLDVAAAIEGEAG
jgi:deoxyribonuclease-4